MLSRTLKLALPSLQAANASAHTTTQAPRMRASYANRRRGEAALSENLTGGVVRNIGAARRRARLVDQAAGAPAEPYGDRPRGRRCARQGRRPRRRRHAAAGGAD